ncbi:hypothetical protein NXW89_31785 [Bacteroides thetaiotaomicron]|nr:hypothetical protein [Bacteroides thetaiotaomicron]
MHWSLSMAMNVKSLINIQKLMIGLIPTWFNLKNSGKTPIVEQHMELRGLMGVFRTV